jgi:hypothetical protein
MIVRIHDGNEVYETEADDCGTKPYIAIKKCRMLRSGIQLYTRDEVPQELLNELPEAKRNQKLFKVYRRPEAIVKHLKDFNYIPLANNHPEVDITPDNRKEYEVGRAGGLAGLVTLKDGNVYVENDLIFDDRAAYNDYVNGKRELSIGLQAVWVVSDSPEYDFEVPDFTNVNHVALVTRGRAGHEAKVMDTMAAVSRSIDINFRENGTGGYGMNFLKMLGIGKNKDGAADFCLSKAVMDCAGKLVVQGITEDEANKVVSEVMNHVVRLGDSEDRKILTGMVRDALTGAKDLTSADNEAKKKVADAIDALYKKCQDADDEKAKAAIEDAMKGKEEPKKDDKDGKGKEEPKKDDEGKKEEGKAKDGCGSQKDTAEVVAEAVARALDAQKLDDKIEAAVAKALGIGREKPEAKGQQTDSAGAGFSAEDLAMNAWNR